MRQQLKWLRNGAFCGILPFGLFYVAAVRLGDGAQRVHEDDRPVPDSDPADAGICHRALPADGRGHHFPPRLAYTLATLCVLAAFYALVFSLGSMVQKNFRDVGSTGLIIVMLMATFLFQPIRDWIQERLDRHFYQDRYDYRRTLVEFARELSSETDMMAMLAPWPSAYPDAFGPPHCLLPGRRTASRTRRAIGW